MQDLRLNWKVVFFIFLFGLQLGQLCAQDKRQQNFYNRIYGDDDHDFDVMIADSIWADASSVILCEKTHISVHSPQLAKNSPVEINGIYRRRILIQDESALQKFSLYYFQKGETVNLKVVKPSGKEISVPLSLAVEVKREVPSFFRKSYIKASYFKIAIPNLEVGDILEYYHVFRYFNSSIVYYQGMFNNELPTQKKEVTFDLSNMPKTFFDTYNTDVKFDVVREGGQSKLGKKRKFADRLRLVLYDLEPKSEIAFLNENADLPHFKLCSYPLVGIFKFLQKKSSDLLNSYDLSSNRTLKLFPNPPSGLVKEYIDKVLFKLKAKERKNFPEGFFYASRYTWNRTGTPNFYMHGVGEKRTDIETLFLNGIDAEFSQFQFIPVFSKYLETYNFKHDIIVVVPNYSGDPKRIVYPGIPYYGIYIEELDQIYWAHNNHRNHLDIPQELANGGRGYRFSILDGKNVKLKKIKDPKSKDFVLPPISSDNAGQTNYIKLSLSQSMDSVSVMDSIIIKGPNKASFYNLLPKFQKFIYSDHVEMYENETVRKAMKGMGEKYMKKGVDYKQIDNDITKQSDTEQSDIFNEFVNDYYGFLDLKIDSFEMINTGRSSVHPDMVFKSCFKLGNFINKAGPNYILDIGMLLGEQTKLNLDEQKSREFNVDFSSAKKYENHIDINLPQDYNVKGLENLNVNIDNEFMRFSAVAKFEDYVLKLYTCKEYKKGFVDKKHWSKLVEVLETAYDFSQKKLILSKQ